MELRELHAQIECFCSMLRQQRGSSQRFQWVITKGEIKCSGSGAVVQRIFNYLSYLKKATSLPWYEMLVPKEIYWCCEDILLLLQGKPADVNLERRKKPTQPARRVEGARKRKDDDEVDGGESKRQSR